MSLYDQKQKLYMDYIKVLNTYRRGGEPVMSQDDAKDICDFYVNTDDAKRINIFADDGELAGFLIIGKHNKEVHKDADYAVAQAYIDPKYRHQGLMTEAVEDYVGNHPGVWSLLVMQRNNYAKEFWPNLFEKLGGRSIPMDMSDVVDDGDMLICFGWVVE